jgi:hypothetical protein
VGAGYFYVKAHMSDPLTQAVNNTLWPYLAAEGFGKLSPRKFVREKNDVFQQLWVDANGVAGKRSTYVILCANLPFGPINGYMDPHGFRISNGRSWSMANSQAAASSVQQVVEALRSSELRKLDEISNIEVMLALLEKLSGRNWYATYSQLYQKWLQKDVEALAIEQANRGALKL